MLAQKHKCHTCSVHLGIVAIKCKCKNPYCYRHIQPEKHDCKFDFKTENKELLEKKLIKVEPQKVNPI